MQPEIRIDTDCALGSWNEDPDDSFAVLYNLLGPLAAQSIFSVGGNTSAEVAAENCKQICSWIDSSGEVICGLNPVSTESSTETLKSSQSQFPVQVLGLGPLTNLARWLSQDAHLIQSAWCTLGHIKTSGSLPPFWPVEFNATQDLKAAEFVFATSVELTVVPLDVAKLLRVSDEVWRRLGESELGRKLQAQCWRWRMRNLLLKAHSHFPAWDLVSATLIENPQLGKIEKGRLNFYKNGLVLCDPNYIAQTHHPREIAKIQKSVRIVTEIDCSGIWNSFFQRLHSF